MMRVHLFVLIVFLAHPAAADNKQAAAAHVSAADKAYKLGRFEEALASYTQAYELYAAPPLLFNIAQCHRNLKNWERAVFFFEGYLRARPDAKNRALVEDLIKEASSALQAEQSAAAAKRAEEEAAARREAEEREKLRLAAEAKRLEEERRVHLEAEARRLEDERRAAAERRARDEQLRLERERTYDRHPFRKWAIVGGGTGAAVVIGGVLFGWASRNAQSSFDDAGCGDPARTLRSDELARCRDDIARADRYALLGNAFVLGGALLIGGSAIVFVLDPGNVPRPRDGVTIGVGPGGVEASVRW